MYLKKKRAIEYEENTTACLYFTIDNFYSSMLMCATHDFLSFVLLLLAALCQNAFMWCVTAETYVFIFVASCLCLLQCLYTFMLSISQSHNLAPALAVLLCDSVCVRAYINSVGFLSNSIHFTSSFFVPLSLIFPL